MPLDLITPQDCRASAQMHLTQDNDVVHSLAPNRSITGSAKPFCQAEAGTVGSS
ncbi:hypothetical protein NB311A_00300 [Nitrobacter sp. Nb-311A]|nr:hypothetical protein NB311A_00300 [Nitrobacter sp. Nb-311A]